MPTTPVIIGRSTADLISNSELFNGAVELLMFGESGLVSGPVAAALPALTADIAGTSTPPSVNGTVVAALPSLSGDIAGTSTAPGAVAGDVAATLPALTSSVTGTSSAPVYTGTIAATLPSLTADVAGTVAGPAITGTVDATLPSLTAAISDAVAGSTVHATLPSLSASIEGDNTVGEGSFGWVGTATAKAIEGYVEHAPVAAPATIVEHVLMRQSHQMPVPTMVDGRYHSDGDYPIVEEPVGTLHAWVDGVDVTYLRDVPVSFGSLRSSLPGADETASIEFPQVHPFDSRDGDLAMLTPDAPVEIAIVPETGDRIHLFAGHLVSDNVDQGPSSNSETWHVEGTLGQADHVGHAVPVTLDPTDIGTLVPDALNSVVSRRYPLIPRVTTGIVSRKRGAYGDTKLDYSTDLLATAWTSGAQQWTVARTGTPRKFDMVLKDITTAHHVLTAAAPGITCNLTEDHSERVDVIYGRGVAADGYSWAGWHFPGFHDYDPPDYPFPDADTVINVGSTGSPVTVVTTRLHDLGFSIAVTSTYTTATKATVKTFQSSRGIKVDGVVGPQTWNELHNLGTNNLEDPIRLPLAGRTECMPYLYDDSGTVTGPNPAYDKSIIVHSIDIDYGPGVTKAEGILSATRQLARDMNPGWVGTITLNTCPWYTSRWEIFEGQNIELLGWRGETILLHVAEVTKDPMSGTVTVTVDTKARDAMTLSSILTRDRQSKADPGRRPGNVNRRSRQEQDMAVEYDGDSPAGRMPRIALFRELWTVWTIPLSQVGSLAKTVMTTDTPKAEFSLGLFGKPITSNALKSLVGDPFAVDAWTRNEAALVDQYGWIEAWGDSTEAAGHYPKGGDGPVTGRLVDTGSVEYVSQRPPWVWVALYSPVSTFAGGRFLPGPVT